MRREWDCFPVERVAPIVEKFIEEWRVDKPLHFRAHQPSGALEYLARHGVSQRALYRIRTGEQQMVGIELLDKILVAMGKHYLFHVAPEDGGFSDIYEHPFFSDEEALSAYEAHMVKSRERDARRRAQRAERALEQAA